MIMESLNYTIIIHLVVPKKKTFKKTVEAIYLYILGNQFKK